MELFLQGCCILVLEDDFIAALDVQQLVEDLGGTVVGPVGRLEDARKLAQSQSLHGAILDVKLDSKTSYPLARELIDTGVPVVFLTGYESESIQADFRDVPRVSKPFDSRSGERVLRSAFFRPAQP